MPFASSPAFLFAPSPKTTLDRSADTGVAPFEDSASTTAVDEILENPGRGAGDSEAAATPERAEGDATPLEAAYAARFALDRGAGTVMKPEPSSVGADVGACLSAFFFLFFFSVLPLERGCGSRNSAACGTALTKNGNQHM